MSSILSVLEDIRDRLAVLHVACSLSLTLEGLALTGASRMLDEIVTTLDSHIDHELRGGYGKEN